MKVSPIILALSGKIGSGKDTAVECLTEHFLGLDKTVVHLKFANALKRASAIITGMPESDQYTKEGKGKTIPGLNMTVGEFQQQCGTVLREHIDQNIWVNAVLNQIKNDPNCVYLISDCRFKNEARKIQEMGGMVIRLNRSKEVDTGGRDTSHVSETDLDDYTANFDFIYQNDGTIDELNKAIIGFFEMKCRKFLQLECLESSRKVKLMSKKRELEEGEKIFIWSPEMKKEEQIK